MLSGPAIDICHALSRFTALPPYLEYGTLKIDSNIAERSIGGLAVGCKNWLLAASNTG
ncbi:MAG: transposase [Hyphomonadaceae bacterium]